MKVLLVSKFLHHVGGVETYVQWLAQALQEAGHELAVMGMTPPTGRAMMPLGAAQVFQTPYRDFTKDSALVRARSAASSVYSVSCLKVARKALDEFRPNVVHFHGTCYQLTSSVVHAVAQRGVPRLATMHEYKLACANQRLWDDRKREICTACVGESGIARRLAPIARRCIKGSLAASTLGSLEDFVSSRIWRNDSGTALHTPSLFIRDLLIRDGWDPERLHHIDLPWSTRSSAGHDRERVGFLYLGRLAPEKGVEALLLGWQKWVDPAGVDDLLVAGDGDDSQRLQEIVATLRIPRVRFLGRLDRSELADMLGRVRATVHPADWYENSPIAVRESLGAGVPALVAKRGGMPELVEPGVTGLWTDNTPQGWVEVLDRLERSDLRAGDSIREHVMRSKPNEEDHLIAMTDLYRRVATWA